MRRRRSSWTLPGATRYPTRHGRCTCSACRARCASSSYVSMTTALPMLRAIKDADEVGGWPRPARPPTQTYEEILKVRFAGRSETRRGCRPRRVTRGSSDIRRSTSPLWAPVRTAPTPTMRSATGSSRTATWWCSTSAASSTATGRTPPAPFTSASPPTRSVRCTTSSAGHNRQASRRCGRASSARRSTACRAQVITEAGYGDYFIHRDRPRHRAHHPRAAVHGGGRNPPRSQPGMCFSIEPGIYLPGRFGVRIEDIVTVTAGRRAAAEPDPARDGDRLVAINPCSTQPSGPEDPPGPDDGPGARRPASSGGRGPHPRSCLPGRRPFCGGRARSGSRSVGMPYLADAASACSRNDE